MSVCVCVRVCSSHPLFPPPSFFRRSRGVEEKERDAVNKKKRLIQKVNATKRISQYKFFDF